jgi:pyruvyltransferase
VSKEIPLFWWSEQKIRNKTFENYGDLISKYLFEKIAERKVKWIHPRRLQWFQIHKKHFLGAGSIIHHGIKSSIVWGSGIISRDKLIPKATFKAVRGPISREMILKAGIDCPEIYGDPGLLMPRFFNPNIEKTKKLGIIPHHTEFFKVSEFFKGENEILVINLETLDVEKTTKDILRCEATISSSLHGLIISHAYRIPCRWVEFSKDLYGDGVKFHDYLESINLRIYKPEFISIEIGKLDLIELSNHNDSLPDEEKIKSIQAKLLEAFPI